MAFLRWSLISVFLCSSVLPNEASPWTAKLPSSVKGLVGSCVVIPCTFDYPDPGRTLSGFTGMWTDAAHQLIYHPVQEKVIQQYRGRTKLLGDTSQKNCSLMIDPLQQSDGGPFNFRIEITGYDKYSFRESSVSITMISEPDPVSVAVKNELKEGEPVSASCSVSYSCPASPPVFNWSHSGEKTFHQEQLDAGQWKATSTLTFHPTRADHEKNLRCTVRYMGGKQQTESKVLKVKYAPVNVKVKYKSDVKEGEAVQLGCSSDANPPASIHQWQNETGGLLHKGNVFVLQNVSRRTGALYCTAINTVGQHKSSPVHLNVLYAPEIRTASSCSPEADTNKVKCVCIAESRPPSMVHFVLSDKIQPKATIEKHGPITIGTLQAEYGSSEFVHCLANNTQGTANITLYFPVNSKMQSVFIYIAAGAGLMLVLLVIAVGVKKCRGRPEENTTTHLSTMKEGKDANSPQYAATKRNEKDYDHVDFPGGNANDHIYGNMETDLDDAIYANV